MTFEYDLKITQMHSSEGEIVELKYKFYPTSNVEQWLLLLEDTMRHSSEYQIQLKIGIRLIANFDDKQHFSIVFSRCRINISNTVPRVMMKNGGDNDDVEK